MKQLHNRVVFEPISRNYLTEKENKREMESLIFLLHKQYSKIKAKKGRYTMIKDIPNAFVKKAVPQDEGYKIIIMNICGALVEILFEIRPVIYKPYVRFYQKNREKILYVRMLKAL